MENGKHNVIINNKYLDIPKQILFKIPIQRSEKVTQNTDKRILLFKKNKFAVGLN